MLPAGIPCRGKTVFSAKTGGEIADEAAQGEDLLVVRLGDLHILTA